MRFLIYSTEIDGAGFPFRLLSESHEVDFFIKDPINDKLLAGIVNRVKTLEEGLKKKPNCIVFDMCHNGELADDLRKKGYNVIGGSKFQDLLELDRFYAMQLAEKMGIAVPPYQTFGKNDIEKAIDFVSETQKRYVLKPNGNLALNLTYVSKSPDDMIQELQWLQEEGKMTVDFLLQEFIEGIEISTECWFSKGKYVGPPNGTIEQKKFMAGNKGPSTGCESSVVWRYKDDDAKIVQQTVSKLYPILREMEYTGPLDVNSIVVDGKAYFLEFTPRFGYSAVYGFLDLLQQDFGQTLYDMATGEAEEMDLSEDISFVLTVSVPPYPLSRDYAKGFFDDLEGKKILNFPESSAWPHDMYYDPDEDCYHVGGYDGLVCFLSAPAPTIEEAEKMVYDIADVLEVSDAQYRIDGADRFKEDISKLSDMDFEVPVLEDRELALETSGGESE